MTYEEIVAALTLATDHPNPTPPPDTIDGTANETDEGPAELMLARLTAARSRYLAIPTTTTSDDYAARHAAWLANKATTYTALDTAVRSLMTLVRSAAPEDPSNPGHNLDPSVDALDPGTPIPNNHDGTTQGYAGCTINLAERYDVSPLACSAVAMHCGAYERAHRRAEPQPARSDSLTFESARLGYTAALTEAEQFLSYLAGP